MPKIKLGEPTTTLMPAPENLTGGDGFVTVPAAAQFLQLSRAKVYSMMDRGELAYCKFGKSRRIPRQALAELVRKSLIAR
jgi:excisionase family DNA binding protein